MIQRTTITCCKGCRDRYPGCHDKCNTYQEQKRERQALLDQEHRKTDISAAIYRAQSRQVMKAYRKRGRK